MFATSPPFSSPVAPGGCWDGAKPLCWCWAGALRTGPLCSLWSQQRLMATTDNAAHGCMSVAAAPGAVRWGIGANRLCPHAASIPPPSFRRRGSALGSPNRDVRVAIGLSLYRGLAVGRLRVPRPFCALRGPPGASPLARPLPGAERVGRASALWSFLLCPIPLGFGPLALALPLGRPSAL